MASINMLAPYCESSPLPRSMENSSKMSWTEMRQAISKSHRVASSLLGRMPSMFTFRTVDTPSGQHHRLYFLGIQARHRDTTLLYVDISDESGDEPAEIKPLLETLPRIPVPYGQLSKEEQLLRERKRLRTYGIMSYDYHEESGRFVFPTCNRLFVCDETVSDAGFSTEPLFTLELRTSCEGSKLDPTICPSNPDLVAYISANDIWVTHTIAGKDRRLTFAHKGGKSLSEDPKSAGVPSFVVQEEFGRFTGYWWQPGKHKNETGMQPVYRILYEEVDESEVQILNIVSPQSDGTAVDEYRYPRAGTNNAKSTLRLLEFQIDSSGAISNLYDVQLPEPLNNLFPWMEYLLRAGWTPDGKYAFAVICDRLQQKLQMVLFSPACFCVPSDSVNGDDSMMINYMSNLTNNMHIIYEDNTDIWLHVHDGLYFFPQTSSQEIEFIYASEKSGFLHLYHIVSSLENVRANIGAASPVFRETQLTEGEWEVDGKEVWVDRKRNLVYFVGYKDTPLESHLYVVPLGHSKSITRLTPLGYSHSVSMDQSCSLFVSVYSNLKTAPSCCIFRLSFTENQVVLASQIQPILEAPVQDYTPPELFSYQSTSGFTMYGLLYKPDDIVPNKKYPTVLFVYAGPQEQMVSNAYKGMRFFRLQTLASLGYVVAMIDTRGSCHRGVKFESHIKHRLGQTEVDDQVEGLQWLAKTRGFIDMTRVAIHGWSYGGYVSLIGLCQRPDIFKLAIAGAPVTSWQLYDTGFTERYMGLPCQNPAGYAAGSVLKHAERFPSEENRLLIVHGLIDENVHFYHTSALISALVKACKPYNLQVYPNERHGIRNPGANEHYETMVLAYLQEHL